MKKAVCLLLACMLFALTACTPEQSAPSGDHVNLPEHDNWVAWEEKQVFPDFTVFEAEIDSEQYYKLEAVEMPGLSVFVSEKESVATVCYAEKTMDMKIMELFPEDGAAVSFELHDLTGDGIPEVCYFHINGGTGACDTDLFIVDVAAMREVQVESPAAFFEGRIGCTLLSKDGGSAVYEVTCGELPPATGALYIREEEELPVLVIGEYYTLLNIQDGLLCCEVGFTMSNAEPGHHLGFARGRYAYNEATGTLEVREETEIILFNAA